MTVCREITGSLAVRNTKGIVSVGPAPCITAPSPPAFLLFGCAYGSGGCPARTRRASCCSSRCTLFRDGRLSLSGFRFCSAANKSKYLRGCWLSFCSDATSGRSNFSPRARNAFGVIGASTCGNHVCPHCLIASMVVSRHFSNLSVALSALR